MDSSEDRPSVINQQVVAEMSAGIKKLKAIEELIRFSNGMIHYIKKRGAATPSQAVFLFKQFRKHSINYNPEKYKIIIMKHREQEQLQSMSNDDIKVIWAALSREQKEWARKHRPPYKKKTTTSD